MGEPERKRDPLRPAATVDAQSSPGKGRAVLRQQRVTAEQAAEHWRAPWEILHCARCGAEVLHRSVYWYTLPHRFDPPIEAIDGSTIEQVNMRVHVLWCEGHLGAAPRRITAPIPDADGFVEQGTLGNAGGRGDDDNDEEG